MGNQIHILSEKQIAMKMKRMAYEIYEQNSQEKEIVLIGIHPGGEIVAKGLKNILQEISPLQVEMRSLTLNKKEPLKDNLTIGTDLNNKSVVLVDDVANSGKTLMYALKPLLNYSPAKIQIAVLVDRKHKNYPIVPDIIGHSVSTTLQDHIIVEVENNDLKGAYLE